MKVEFRLFQKRNKRTRCTKFSTVVQFQLNYVDFIYKKVVCSAKKKILKFYFIFYSDLMHFFKYCIYIFIPMIKQSSLKTLMKHTYFSKNTTCTTGTFFFKQIQFEFYFFRYSKKII